jgi:hypothetical protein
VGVTTREVGGVVADVRGDVRRNACRAPALFVAARPSVRACAGPVTAAGSDSR